MRFPIAVLAISLAAPLAASPPIQAPRVLVLNSRQRMEVREFHVDGRVVRATSLDGEPLMIRAEQVDIIESERISELHQASAEKALRDESERVQRAAEEAQVRADARQATLAESKARQRRGSMSLASNLGHTDDSPTAPAVAGETPTARAESTSGGSDLAGMRARYRANRAKRAQLSRDRDALAPGGKYPTWEAATMGGAMLREIDALDSEADALKAEFTTAREASRKSGADASEWRSNIEG